MTTPYMFGNGAGTPQLLQQSFCIIRKDGFEPFIKRLNNIVQTDQEVAPETKFIIASSNILSMLPIIWFKELVNFNSFKGRLIRFLVNKLQKNGMSFNYLPIGYGRTRPIKFEDDFYYFQHGCEDELKKHFLEL